MAWKDLRRRRVSACLVRDVGVTPDRRSPPSDRAMASPSPRRRSAVVPAAQTGLPDEIWEEIFLRLDAAADLARASAACSSFRRIVSERRFLRRFRSLHSPPVLGFISKGRLGFVPVQPPHRSAPEARALEQAADFTFSFLPDPSAWSSRHARDGRVLLSRRIRFTTQFDYFIVCDPLHRRYVKIPRIPDDLKVSIPRTGAKHLSPVLAPADDNDDGDESFRVICTVHLQLEDKVMAFVFSSCSQTWQAIISTICLPNNFIGCMSYYAHGCLYWMFYRMRYSLKLDMSELKFSIDLSPHNFHSNHVIVEAEEGRLGFLSISDGAIGLYCKNCQSNGVGAQEWQYNKLIPLPKDSGINYTYWTIVGTVGHYSALLGSRHISHELRKHEYFVLDTKTLLLEKVCACTSPFLGIPYARFPPPFALPSI